MTTHRRPIAAAAVALAAAPLASAGVTTLELRDHPGAFHAPPTYGLRLDHIFAAIGGPVGITTFSFDHFSNSTLTINNNVITISGTVYGGLDTGNSWGYGEGAYELNFSYVHDVTPQGTGWVAGPSALNAGTLTALGNNNGVPMGTVFEMTDKADHTGLSFLLLQDGHRLTPEQVEGMNDPWIGRGWLMLDDGQMGTRDWLFVAIPGPGTALAAGVALAAGARRRRR